MGVLSTYDGKLTMHEMWWGPAPAGEPSWHVLAADKSSTMCGVPKPVEPSTQEPTDKHCFLCMKAFQAEMA
jgi:hypothetical protein